MSNIIWVRNETGNPIADYWHQIHGYPFDRKEPRMELTTADELRYITKPPMLIDEIIPKGSITLVVGPTYSGKTWFALEAARVVSGFGDKFMGRWARAHLGNVLFIEQDAPKYDTGRALWSLIKENAPNLDMQPDGAHPMRALRIAWHPRFDLCTAVDVGKLIGTANSLYTPLGFTGRVEHSLKETSLIIFDTFRRAHTAEENSSTEMQPIMNQLTNIQKNTGAAIILIHHCTKGEFKSSRGSSAIEGSVDNIFMISKKRGKITVEVEKARAIQPPNWTYAIETEEDEKLGVIKRVVASEAPVEVEPPKKAQPSTPRVDSSNLFHWLIGEAPFTEEGGWGTPQQDAELLNPWGKSRATIHRWLKELEKQGKIRRERVGGRVVIFPLTGGGEGGKVGV